MVDYKQAYGDAYGLRKSPEMISSKNPYFIILPIVLTQYVLATFALVRLARARLSTSKYVVWNLFVLIVFFVGSITFLIYDAVRKKPDDEGQEKITTQTVSSGETVGGNAENSGDEK